MDTIQEPEKLEILKLLYEKAVEQQKYFLSWRQYLLTGFFTATSLMYYASFVLFEKGCSYYTFASWVLMIHSLLSFCFYLLERRNIVLYKECMKVAKSIELKILTPEYQLMPFYQLEQSYSKSIAPSHSNVILAIYVGSMLCSLLTMVIVN